MKKETMFAIAENLSNLSKLFAEAAVETDASVKLKKKLPPSRISNWKTSELSWLKKARRERPRTSEAFWTPSAQRS
jgi:hypothetical protein